jgi:hypothetical protein
MSKLCRSVPTLPLALGLFASSWWLTPSQSRACLLVAPDPVFRGVPADGDTDVPTDVVLLFQIPFGLSLSAPRTRGRARSRSVAINTRSLPARSSLSCGCVRVGSCRAGAPQHESLRMTVRQKRGLPRS